MRYKFISENKNKYPIGKMAKILGVCKNGYYEYLKHPVSNREIENIKLVLEIKEIHKKSRFNYGSPRIYEALKKKGIKCGKNKVIRLMRKNDIHSKTKKKFKVTTNSKHNNPVYENILDRNFRVNEPNKLWISDITYIWTNEGWLYLCTVIDLYSRKVVGWSMSERIDTELVKRAFLMAWNQRKPKGKLLFHSDRGVQYTSKDFQKVLKDKQVLCSMSRKGNCWDNACAESFFHTLKVEEVHHTVYENREIAKIKIFEFIEAYYNNFRTHSYLDYMNPNEFENKKIA
jgi:transposase InsO family protein